MAESAEATLAEVNAVLSSRIEKAMAAVLPSEQERVNTLRSLADIDSPASRFEKLCECLSDYSTYLEAELSRSQVTQKYHLTPPDPSRHSSDYEAARNIVGARPGELTDATAHLLQNNIQLQRLHNQDHALMRRQTDLITSLRSPPAEQSEPDETRLDALSRDLGEIERSLANLEEDIRQKVISAKRK